jgi:beta-phosphoglucomutase-like phosphatase (HAD superfamily)
MDWSQFEAALFDLDGVLTPTADLHMRAWRQMFSTYFVEHDVAPAYTNADYFTYVDGKPRYDGVRATLASRGIELPEGDPADERAPRLCPVWATPRTPCSTACCETKAS